MARKIASSSASIVGIGKAAFYAQMDLDQSAAYDYTKEVMTANALASDAHEGITAFLENARRAGVNSAPLKRFPWRG